MVDPVFEDSFARPLPLFPIASLTRRPGRRIKTTPAGFLNDFVDMIQKKRLEERFVQTNVTEMARTVVHVTTASATGLVVVRRAHARVKNRSESVVERNGRSLDVDDGNRFDRAWI